MSVDLFRPYYCGQYGWDNYLLDIQKSIDAGMPAQKQSLRIDGETLKLAEGQAVEVYQQSQGLREMSQTLQVGFEQLGADFQWGFTLLLDRMDQQVGLMSQIADHLDVIHKNLMSPLMKEWRELFHLGQERLRAGLLDKALEMFLQAEQKNDVNFPLQFQVGKLLLYGKNSEINIVDFTEAERHLILAARYAEAERGAFDDWNTFCGQAHFHAAVAAYLIGEQHQKSSSAEASRECLERALQHLAQALALCAESTEIAYFQAKCLALLGQNQEALSKIESLSDRDRRYFAKIKQDKDFDPLQSEILEVFTKAAETPGPFARTTETILVGAIEALAWVKRLNPEATWDPKKIESIERTLNSATPALRSLDVDLENLRVKLNFARRDLDSITEGALQRRLDMLQSEIEATESRKSRSEYRVRTLTEEMKQTKTTAIAILVGILSYFGSYPILHSIAAALGIEVQNSEPQGVVPALIIGILALLIAVAAALAGRHIARYVMNKEKRERIRESNLDAIDCDRRLVNLRRHRQEVSTEYGKYSAWKTSTPAFPCPPKREDPAWRRASATFAVVLSSIGSNKTRVIEVVREVASLDLKEASDLLETVPKTVKNSVSKDEAEQIARKFAEAGATVNVTETQSRLPSRAVSSQE